MHTHTHIYLNACIYHILSVDQLVDEYLGWFHISVAVSSVAVSMLCKHPCDMLT